MKFKVLFVAVFSVVFSGNNLLAQQIDQLDILAATFSNEKAIYTNKSEHLVITTKKNEMIVSLFRKSLIRNRCTYIKSNKTRLAKANKAILA